jgi:hypothetical protein
MAGGGGDIGNTEADLTLMRMGGRAPRHWNRGVMIRFVLAISPTVAFAILGAVQQHAQAH